MSEFSPQIPDQWRRISQSMRTRVNAGWFWNYFSRLMLAAFGFMAVLIWLLRLQRVDTFPAWCLGAGAILVAGLWSSHLAADKRIGLGTALSRLDVGWGLNHRLISAWQGVGAWPPVPENQKLPLRVKSVTVFTPLCLSYAAILMVLFLPLPPQQFTEQTQRREPPDWQALETLADQLDEQDLVEKEATQTLRQELSQLRDKPNTDWYDPSTLEATDRMRTRMHSDAARLSDAMRNTSKLLNLAEQGRDHLTPQQQNAMQQFMEQMRNQMGEGGLKLNPQLMQQLEQIDLAQLQQIDAQQLQQLEQQLMQNAQRMEQALVQAGLLQGMGEMPGRGGVSRGGGPSELTLKDFETIVQPVMPMALDPGSLENAQIGELLELRETEHEDEREHAPISAGGIQSQGGSGEVVWDQDVLPAEAKVLKEFFK